MMELSLRTCAKISSLDDMSFFVLEAQEITIKTNNKTVFLKTLKPISDFEFRVVYSQTYNWQ